MFQFNLQLKVLRENLSGKGLSNVGTPSTAAVTVTYLNCFSKAHQLVVDAGDESRRVIRALITAILQNESPPKFQPLTEKLEKIPPAMEIAHEEFVKTIHLSHSATSSLDKGESSSQGT